MCLKELRNSEKEGETHMTVSHSGSSDEFILWFTVLSQSHRDVRGADPSFPGGLLLEENGCSLHGWADLLPAVATPLLVAQETKKLLPVTAMGFVSVSLLPKVVIGFVGFSIFLLPLLKELQEWEILKIRNTVWVSAQHFGKLTHVKIYFKSCVNN